MCAGKNSTPQGLEEDLKRDPLRTVRATGVRLKHSSEAAEDRRRLSTAVEARPREKR